MEITVNVYGEVRKRLPPGKKPVFALRAPSKTSVQQILDYLKLPADLPLAIVVNGDHSRRDRDLADGDVISLFSMATFEPGQQ